MKNLPPNLHPELQSIASKIPDITFSAKNLGRIRFFSRFLKGQKPEDVIITNLFIPTDTKKTDLRLRVYRPKSMTAPAPVMVWLHGGGYIMGLPEQDDPCCIDYTRELGMTVVSVDYPLAPEHPFPDALEGSYRALEWVASHAAELGVDPHRIAIGGASAGGGLAAALAQFALDLDEIQPAFQLLVYPMLDDRTVLRAGKQVYPVWNLESNRFGWESYLRTPCGMERASPFSVPARLSDLSGLPPAWIGVGTLDLFHDEDVAYAQRLRDCGVDCEVTIVPGVFHGFDTIAQKTQVAKDFRASQIAALKRRFFS